MLTRNIEFPPKKRSNGFLSSPSPELKTVIEDSGLVYGGSGASRLCLFYKNMLAIKINKAHMLALANKELGIEDADLLLNENEVELRNYERLCKEFPFLDVFLLPYYHYFSCGDNFISVFPKAKTPFKANPFNNEPYLKNKLGLILEIFGDSNMDNVGYYKDVWLIDFNTEENGLLISSKMKIIERFLSEFQEEISETRKLVKEIRNE